MPRKKQAKELFDDNEEFDDHDGSPLPVNEEYAKRFEVRGVHPHTHWLRVVATRVHLVYTLVNIQQHNARRAELHRLKEKHPEQYARLQARGALDDDEDGQEESSTSEDEVGGVDGCVERAHGCLDACLCEMYTCITHTHAHIG